MNNQSPSVSGEPSRRIVAFYGFKGGAGRSLLLANTAALLAAAGRNVLVIDADLEAPGLGDFFDTEGEMLFSEWRLREGFLDFMNELFDQSVTALSSGNSDRLYGEKLRNLLMSESDDNDIPGKRFFSQIPVPKAKIFSDNRVVKEHTEGKVFLMGPGSHRLSSVDGSFRFVAEILSLDWNTMIHQNRRTVADKEIFSSLRELLLSGVDFHDVLIDGRTGYNAASLITIQNLATDVVLVGSSSMQSIDGIARMRPYFTGPPNQPTGIKAHLVISKMSGSKPDPKHKYTRRQASITKQELNDIYHIDYDFWDFPFVEDFVTGDSLMFRRSGLIENDDETVILYKDKLLDFAREITGAPIQFDKALLDLAFARWGNKGRIIQHNSETSSDDFSEYSSDLDQVIALRARKRINDCISSIEEFLDTFEKQEANAVEGEFQLSTKSALEGRVKETFEALRLEERALVRAEAGNLIQKKDYPADAVRLLTRIIRLSVLPNVATYTQLRAFKLDEQNDNLSEEEFRPTSLDQQIRKQHKMMISEYCRQIIIAKDNETLANIRNNIIKIRNEQTDSDFRDTLDILLLFAGNNQSDHIGGLIRLIILFDSKNPFLPNFIELADANLLDVARVRIDANLQRLPEPEIGTTLFRLCSRVLNYIQNFTLDDAARDKDSCARQLLHDVKNWTSIWTAAAAAGNELQISEIMEYPDRDILRKSIFIVASIETNAHIPADIRVFAAAVECRLWIELDDHSKALAALHKGFSIVKTISVTSEDRSPQNEIRELLRASKQLGETSISWKLDRIYHSFDILIGYTDAFKTFDLESYNISNVNLFDFGLLPNFTTYPDNDKILSDDFRDSIEKVIGWWPSISDLRKGLIQKAIVQLENIPLDEGLAPEKTALLVQAYASINQGDEAIEAYEKWVSLSVSSRRDWHTPLPTFLSITNSLLAYHLANMNFDEFDSLYESTDLPNSKIVNKLAFFTLQRRTLLYCLRSNLGSIQSARNAETALKKLITDIVAQNFPQDREFINIVGGSWDGLGAFSGVDYPEPARGVLSSMILDVCGLQLTAFPNIDLNNWLSKVECLIWGQDDRACGKTKTLIEDRFLQPIQFALYLPRAKLECIRHTAGLPSDMDIARSAMEFDIKENGSGRSIYYPHQLQ